MPRLVPVGGRGCLLILDMLDVADVGQGVGSVCITLWMVGELELCGV